MFPDDETSESSYDALGVLDDCSNRSCCLCMRHELLPMDCLKNRVILKRLHDGGLVRINSYQAHHYEDPPIATFPRIQLHSSSRRSARVRL